MNEKKTISIIYEKGVPLYLRLKEHLETSFRVRFATEVHTRALKMP